MTQEASKQEAYQILICYVQDFLVRHFPSPERGKDSQTPEERFSLKLPDWLKISALHIFCLKMYPDSYRMAKGGRFTPSSVRFMNWGIMWNGKCLTARISESHSQENDCILSDILMEDVPGKYYLSKEQTERLLYKSAKAVREKESTIRTE